MSNGDVQLTDIDMAKLAYPFPREDHSFLQGYVYVEEEAISARLDTVDPNWSISIDEAVAYGDSIAVRSTLTIKGVSRSNIGGNPVQRDSAEKDGNGNKTGAYIALPLYTQADNGVNAYKAAATDALKRCCRMFGIGRYLLSAPKEGKAFDEWLKRIHDEARARYASLTGVDTATGEIKRPTNGNGHEQDSVRVEQSSAKVVGVQPNRPTPPPVSVAESPVESVASGDDNPLFDDVEDAVITTIRPDEQVSDDDYRFYPTHKVFIKALGKKREFVFQSPDDKRFKVPEAKVNNLKTEVIMWATGKVHDLPTTVWVEARAMDETEKDWDVRSVSDEVKPE